jgi:hypothetical protein
MLMCQNCGCAICSEKAPEHKSLCVDHNHKTGKIRGLLCGNCNLMIGLVKDNPTILRHAITYLETSI